jgi:hypothetical protein
MATVAKRQKMGPTIGTHSGSFHCDEALGTFLLKQTAAYADATITRTRDPAVLETLDVVIDVGGTYEPGGAGAVRWLSAAHSRLSKHQCLSLHPTAAYSLRREAPF